MISVMDLFSLISVLLWDNTRVAQRNYRTGAIQYDEILTKKAPDVDLVRVIPARKNRPDNTTLEEHVQYINSMMFMFFCYQTDENKNSLYTMMLSHAKELHAQAKYAPSPVVLAELQQEVKELLEPLKSANWQTSGGGLGELEPENVFANTFYRLNRNFEFKPDRWDQTGELARRLRCVCKQPLSSPFNTQTGVLSFEMWARVESTNFKTIERKLLQWVGASKNVLISALQQEFAKTILLEPAQKEAFYTAVRANIAAWAWAH
jgi:hypothetical protein